MEPVGCRIGDNSCKIMKRLLLAAALLIGMICSANAQKPLSLGIRAGVNVNSLSHSGSPNGSIYNDLSLRSGYHLGVVLDWHVFGGFYVEPGVYLTNRGAEADVSESYWVDRDAIYYSQDTDLKINMTYLQIPILAQYRFGVGPVKIDVNLGPYFAFGLGGKMKEKSSNSLGESYSESLKIFEKSTETTEGGDFGRFDFGLRFGAGVHFLSHYYAGIYYDLGLTNLAQTGEFQWGDKTTFKNRSFGITLGYNF